MTEAPVIVPLTIIRKHSNGKVEVYKKNEELGRGGFATVFRITNENTGETFALKATSRERLKKIKVLQKHKSEVAIQRSLNHPNILKLYDFFEDSQNTYMVLELAPGRSIRDLVKSKGHLSENETVKILQDVIEGLNYLHDNRIIHRDLKLDNFLIGADNSVKIADFGLSAKLDYDDEKKFTVCGTPNYLSPELLASTNHGHSYEVDIWAIGVCTFAMLTGTPPFETRHTKDTYEHIKNCQYRFPYDLTISNKARSFIKNILQLKPELRPSSYELQQHSFMQSLGPYPDPVSAKNMKSDDKKENKEKKRKQQQQKQKQQQSTDENSSGKGSDENITGNETKSPTATESSEQEKMISMPDFCVSRFCDHSEKYGLGYLLINGTVGALFNDLSRMIIDPFEEFVQYYESYTDQQPMVIRKDDVNLIKKLSILQKFSESLRKTKTMFKLPEKHFEKFQPMRHVKYWTRNEEATLFRMDDRNIQVNFTDRMKTIIFWKTKKIITVKSINELALPIPLDDLSKKKGLEDQKRRFMIVKTMVAQMSSH